ncbi:unnamed protein product, partial [Sphacelaria rigidula]
IAFISALIITQCDGFVSSSFASFSKERLSTAQSNTLACFRFGRITPCRTRKDRISGRSCADGVRSLSCGLQVTVRIRGKKSREEDYTNQAYDEYAKRLRPVLALETQWHKTDEELEAAVRKDPGVVVCLDEGGRQMDSPTFSDFLFTKLESGGSRLTFVIGGAEGLPPGLKSNPPQGGAKLSLSSMTFTHLWARALLAEQIYRASEIRRGSKYHKQ